MKASTCPAYRRLVDLDGVVTQSIGISFPEPGKLNNPLGDERGCWISTVNEAQRLQRLLERLRENVDLLRPERERFSFQELDDGHVMTPLVEELKRRKYALYAWL